MSPENPHVDHANMIRSDLDIAETSTRNRIKCMKRDNVSEEVIAQATLALRHIEDARMRYGKVIQYLWDWVSKYDKDQQTEGLQPVGDQWPTGEQMNPK